MTWWDLRGDLLSHSRKTNKQTTTAANCTAWSNCCSAVGSRNSMLCLTAQRAQTRPEKGKPLPKLQALVYDILPLEEDAGKRCSECDPVQALCRQVKIVLVFFFFVPSAAESHARSELVAALSPVNHRVTSGLCQHKCHAIPTQVCLPSSPPILLI